MFPPIVPRFLIEGDPTRLEALAKTGKFSLTNGEPATSASFAIAPMKILPFWLCLIPFNSSISLKEIT